MIKKIAIMVVLILCSIFLIHYTTMTNNSKNIIEIKNLRTIEELEMSYVYFGRDSCSDCVAFKPYMEKVLSKNSKSVNYVDTQMHKENNLYKEIKNKYNIKYVPTLIFINKGKIIKTFNMTNYEKLTNENDKLKYISSFFEE